MLKTPAFLYGIKGYRNTIVRAFAITGQIGYQFPTRSFDVVQNAGAQHRHCCGDEAIQIFNTGLDCFAELVIGWSLRAGPVGSQ